MKKIILSLLVLISCLVTYANDRIVTKEIQAAFKKEFPNAEALTWNQVDDFTRATFILDGHRTIAYFTSDGNFAGSIRYLFFNQLPLAAMSAVDKKYKDADILEVYEITNDEGTSYKVNLQITGKEYKLRVDANGNITQSERVKK